MYIKVGTSMKKNKKEFSTFFYSWNLNYHKISIKFVTQGSWEQEHMLEIGPFKAVKSTL